VNGDVYPYCADVPLRIYLLTHSSLAELPRPCAVIVGACAAHRAVCTRLQLCMQVVHDVSNYGGTAEAVAVQA